MFVAAVTHLDWSSIVSLDKGCSGQNPNRVAANPYLPALYIACTTYIDWTEIWVDHTFLGLLAKIKCSICSLEFDNSNGGHCPPCYLTYFSGGLPNSDACIAGLAAWPWHCTTALAEHPLNNC